jgi:leucyl/phenylalanyl-tRNA--protein transferase
MPVYELLEEIIFPHPSLAEPDGLLAIGGDLSPERLLLAYANGIFPWYSEDEPILWWSPDPRCVCIPKEYIPSKSLRLLVQKQVFKVKFDTCFKEVISNCALAKRKAEQGTWITSDIISAYCNLHDLGFAHSVEIFLNEKLVGGLYGVSLGKAFFGESMFHKVSNASKIAYYFLMQRLVEWGFDIVDNQMVTPHLLSLGAKEMNRDRFLEVLSETLKKETHRGKWK